MNKTVYKKVRKMGITCLHISKEIDRTIKKKENDFFRWLQVKTSRCSKLKKAMLISLFVLGFLSCYAAVLTKTIKWENNKEARVNQRKTVNEPMVMTVKETKDDLLKR